MSTKDEKGVSRLPKVRPWLKPLRLSAATRPRIPPPEREPGNTCPDCGKPLSPKKSWGGLAACYCRFGGRKPSAAQIEKALDAHEAS